MAIGSALGLLGLVASGCEDRAAPESAPGSPLGTLVIDGKPTTITQCAVGLNAAGDGIFLDLIHAGGRLRFTRLKLYASAQPKAVGDGVELTCAKLDRSWGGGLRADGTGYWRGMLDFRCAGDATQGKIELECGAPTSNEKASLDIQRDARRNPPGTPGSGSGSAGSGSGPSGSGASGSGSAMPVGSAGSNSGSGR